MASSKHTPIVVVVVLVLLGAVAGAVIGAPGITDFFKYDHYNKIDFIDPDAYQAVFLMNDQIYFGHLKNISSDYLLLSDVYYVKINEDGAGQLVKLGASEPHGPQDKMIINQDQVLFWENMRFDSQVVKTIQSIEQRK